MFRLVIVSTLIACTLCAVPLPRALQKDGRIVGGNVTDISKHPYQLSLLRDGTHRCGAAIVSSEWAITNAFCTFNRSVEEISFRAGSSVINSGGSIHNATLIVIHPSYIATSGINDFDISLVKVSPPFEFNENVQAVDLGSVVPAPGETVVVSGWGVNEEGSYSDDLTEVELNTIENRFCSRIYEIFGGLTDNMICASISAGGKGTCAGDQGDPTVLDGKLVGLPTFGVGCGSKGYPDVFTSIVAFRSWIYIVITEIK